MLRLFVVPTIDLADAALGWVVAAAAAAAAASCAGARPGADVWAALLVATAFDAETLDPPPDSEVVVVVVVSDLLLFVSACTFAVARTCAVPAFDLSGHFVVVDTGVSFQCQGEAGRANTAVEIAALIRLRRRIAAAASGVFAEAYPSLQRACRDARDLEAAEEAATLFHGFLSKHTPRWIFLAFLLAGAILEVVQAVPLAAPHCHSHQSGLQLCLKTSSRPLNHAAC
jgi:hypothetical protein